MSAQYPSGDPASLRTLTGDEVLAVALDDVVTEVPDDLDGLLTVERAGGERIEVPIGRRVMILGDLLLPVQPSATSSALSEEVASTLDRWQGPGTLIVCGSLFEVNGDPESGAAPYRRSLEAHPRLRHALRAFTARDDCRVIVLPDTAPATFAALEEPLGEIGVSVRRSIELALQTAAGTRHVLVCPGERAETSAPAGSSSPERRPWLSGIERLEDPDASSRFITSRTLYRRLGRVFVLLALTPVVAAILLRLPFIFGGLNHLFQKSARARHALNNAYTATWPNRLLVTAGVTVVLLIVMAIVVAIASRIAWTALGGGALPRPWRPDLPPTGPSSGRRVEGYDALDRARELVADGSTGLIASGTLHAELTHLDPGFFASPGGTTEIVREHPGRLGLPPVFLQHRQSAWVELETGADLHVRLLLADVVLPTSTFLERLATTDHVVKGKRPAGELHPAMVASWPLGASWPPTLQATATRARVRRVRRVVALAIFVAGLLDLLSALTPPIRGHLHLVLKVLPLGVAQAAGALVALSGIALLMLARGVLRGQRRSWAVAVGLLTVTLVLHVIHGIEFDAVAVAIVVLFLLLIEREHFAAATDRESLRSAVVTLVVGGVSAVILAVIAIEITGAVRHHALHSWPTLMAAAAERLVGLTTISLPDPIDDWITPSLVAVGIAIALVTLYLLTRPVVDRGLSSPRAATARRAAELRARDIVRRHGSGTLDYFALRDDKQWYFARDSLVAYAVYGGMCLVSPDPIGPRNERAQVWTGFRHFADRHGWGVGVMAASEEWLPFYRESGMRHLYVGDEAVVDVQSFALGGGKMKGLRQAVNRVANKGYTVDFYDPSHLDPELVAKLVALMTRNRRGEEERGFSMMLGRLFDPRDGGLLLTVVTGPDGVPAAMCQFVPSRAIDGFSLDLMRRDPGEHPNGLLDFALCSTIEHLRTDGQRGLSLNFAALRSTLDGETGDGVTQRVERWALRRLSGVLQIETLWRFNAKYEPNWLPRYIVYDSAEQFVPTAVQIMRAESLTEIPVVGRLMSTTGRRSAMVSSGSDGAD